MERLVWICEKCGNTQHRHPDTPKEDMVDCCPKIVIDINHRAAFCNGSFMPATIHEEGDVNVTRNQ